MPTRRSSDQAIKRSSDQAIRPSSDQAIKRSGHHGHQGHQGHHGHQGHQGNQAITSNRAAEQSTRLVAHLPDADEILQVAHAHPLLETELVGDLRLLGVV
eukprot:4456881-Prymnesium_polylepis.1